MELTCALGDPGICFETARRIWFLTFTKQRLSRRLRRRSGSVFQRGTGRHLAPYLVPASSPLPLFLPPLPLPLPPLSPLWRAAVATQRPPLAPGSAATAGTAGPSLHPDGSEGLARLLPSRETEGARRCPLIRLVCTPACRCVKRGWVWMVEFWRVKRDRDCRTASEMSSGKIDGALFNHGIRAVSHQDVCVTHSMV